MAEHQPPSLPNSPLHKRTRMESSKQSEPAQTQAGLQDAPVLSDTTVPGQSIAELLELNASALSKSTPLQVKKLSLSARIPTRGSAFAAGYDIYSAETATVPARGKAMLSTGISIAVPPGTYGRVAPRSGLAAKHSLATGAGVIDYDYRGEVKILLFNHSDVDFEIQEGDRMAQLVLERIVTPDVVEVEELDGTERGAGGFGSTGGFGAVNGAVG